MKQHSSLRASLARHKWAHDAVDKLRSRVQGSALLVAGALLGVMITNSQTKPLTDGLGAWLTGVIVCLAVVLLSWWLTRPYGEGLIIAAIAPSGGVGRKDIRPTEAEFGNAFRYASTVIRCRHEPEPCAATLTRTAWAIKEDVRLAEEGIGGRPRIELVAYAGRLTLAFALGLATNRDTPPALLTNTFVGRPGTLDRREVLTPLAPFSTVALSKIDDPTFVPQLGCGPHGVGLCIENANRRAIGAVKAHVAQVVDAVVEPRDGSTVLEPHDLVAQIQGLPKSLDAALAASATAGTTARPVDFHVVLDCPVFLAVMAGVATGHWVAGNRSRIHEIVLHEWNVESNAYVTYSLPTDFIR